MYRIHMLRADQVISFAAEELKKYLRMMMPECGDIPVSLAPDAGDGFRLGLAEDFGIAIPEAEDPVLDDVVIIDTDENGGILAGSNPRSVLFAVYRYLKENGCRWLFPGVDGEVIPLADVKAVQYRHKAAHRFRGWCNEGAEFQQNMMETIDFAPKLEMNVYMLEFDIPYTYYRKYYDHLYNEENRPPETVSFMQVKQWKRQCETEIAKRGLQFHDMGHGWTAEPFGISSTVGWQKSTDELPPEKQKFVAEIGGVRQLFGGVALNTNICMSNPEARSIMVQYIADYAQSHANVDYLHIWLADATRNHCECGECRKLRPSDYYMMIMNELDAELTKRSLDTRIVFIAYVDTLYAPEKIRIDNPKRFALLYAPIQRSYHASIDIAKITEPPAYERNAWKTPASAEENAAFLLDWQKWWKGPCFCYEYHFWRHMAYDPGGLILSRRIYEDVRVLKSVGLQGIVEDGSQRCFFPNGLALYTYAAALLDDDISFEEIRDDFFTHLYGDCRAEAESCLERISELFDFGRRGRSGNAEHAEILRGVYAVAAEERKLAESHRIMPNRPQTTAMRILHRHAEYCELLADVLIERAQGNKEAAAAAWQKLCREMGKYEFELERCYDHYMLMHAQKP